MTAPVTRHDIWRAMHIATRTRPVPMPVPHRIKFLEAQPGKAPLVCLDHDSHDDARAWADYLGIADTEGTHTVGGTVAISFVGVWLGWRVLLAADEPTQRALVGAVLAPDAEVA